MANEIKDKLGTPTALTITLASLASSTANVGRQSTMVANASPGIRFVLLVMKIKLGTTPTGNRAVYVYLIRGDGTGVRDDSAGASDAAFTVLNCELIGEMRDLSSPSTGDVLTKSFLVRLACPEWGIAVTHDTAVALDATGGNFLAEYITVDEEIQ